MQVGQGNSTYLPRVKTKGNSDQEFVDVMGREAEASSQHKASDISDLSNHRILLQIGSKNNPDDKFRAHSISFQNIWNSERDSRFRCVFCPQMVCVNLIKITQPFFILLHYVFRYFFPVWSSIISYIFSHLSKYLYICERKTFPFEWWVFCCREIKKESGNWRTAIEFSIMLHKKRDRNPKPLTINDNSYVFIFLCGVEDNLAALFLLSLQLRVRYTLLIIDLSVNILT